MKLEQFTPHSAALLACLLLAAFTPRAAAQSAAATPAYGPYNVHSISGGIGVTKTLAAHDPLALSGPAGHSPSGSSQMRPAKLLCSQALASLWRRFHAILACATVNRSSGRATGTHSKPQPP